MKTCGRCKVEQPLENFPARKGRKDGLSYTCKACKKVIDKEYYQRNKEKYQHRRVANRTRLRNYIWDVKNVPCADCKQEYHPVAMDFDHVRQEKVDNIAKMVVTQASLDKIKAEIEKCDIVCSNCHRVRTYKRHKSTI